MTEKTDALAGTTTVGEADMAYAGAVAGVALDKLTAGAPNVASNLLASLDRAQLAALEPLLRELTIMTVAAYNKAAR